MVQRCACKHQCLPAEECPLLPAIRPTRATGASVQITAILLLPAVFAVFGAWEITRGNATVAAFTGTHARVAVQLDRLQALARSDPQATVRFRSGDGQPSYAAPLAAQMMADDESELAADLTVAEVRLPFAWLSTAAALLSLLGGLAGLGIVADAARRSMRSRDALVRAFRQVRRAVPFALGLQVTGVALALLGVVGFEGGGLWFLETVSGNELKLVVAGLIAAALALWGAFQSIRQLRRAFGLFQPRPATLLGIPVTEPEAPGLFALMRELARDQEAVVPQTVVAGAVAGFFVTSHPQRLPAAGTVARGRTLHVPLPQLAVLSRAETRAVLAHELAHFSGGDTAYSTQFQPVYAALQHSMAAVANRRRSAEPVVDRMLRPASSLGEYVLGRFDRSVKHWSRLREFQADQGALATEQPGALATSLLRTAVAAEIVGAQLRAMAERPGDASADLVEQTLRIAAEQGFIEPGRHLEDRQPHPTDTHPPTVQRIEAAGVAVDDGLLARAARPVDSGELAAAQALFVDWPGLCSRVTAQLHDLAVKQEQDRLAQAEAAVAAVGDAPVALHEHRVRMVATLGITALICLALGAGLVWLVVTGTPDAHGDDTNTVLLCSATACVMGGLAACFGLVRFARNRDPFLVLTAQGFSSPGFTGTVPWTAVAGVAVMAGRGVTTTLTLAPDQPLPLRTGRIWRLRTRRRRNALVLSGLIPRGMKPQAYLDLLLRYHRAALARATLACQDQ